MTANGISMPLASVGYVITLHLSLPNVYFILKLRLNLISISQLCDSVDYLVISPQSFYCVQDLKSQNLIGTGCRESKLYILD